jgi:hypothetical protein
VREKQITTENTETTEQTKTREEQRSNDSPAFSVFAFSVVSVPLW